MHNEGVESSLPPEDYIWTCRNIFDFQNTRQVQRRDSLISRESRCDIKVAHFTGVKASGSAHHSEATPYAESSGGSFHHCHPPPLTTITPALSTHHSLSSLLFLDLVQPSPAAPAHHTPERAPPPSIHILPPSLPHHPPLYPRHTLSLSSLRLPQRLALTTAIPRGR